MIRNVLSQARRLQRFRPVLDQLEDRTVPTVITFNIDPTMSSLTLSAFIHSALGDTTLQEQGPGSLSDTYSGTATVDLASDLSAIQFLDDPSYTDAVAGISGQWAPLRGGGSGTDDANYGGKGSLSGINAIAAVRDAVVGATSSPLALTDDGNGGLNFQSTQTCSVNQGSADYRAGPVFGQFYSGNFDVSGNSAQNSASAGDLSTDSTGTQYLLAIPIHVLFHKDVSQLGGYVELTVDGVINGSAAIPMAPHGSSGSLVSVAVASSSSSTGQVANLPAGGAQSTLNDSAVQWSKILGQGQDARTDNAIQQSGTLRGAEQLAAVDAIALEMIGNDSLGL
jgi:hypothetical protein